MSVAGGWGRPGRLRRKRECRTTTTTTSAGWHRLTEKYHSEPNADGRAALRRSTAAERTQSRASRERASVFTVLCPRVPRPASRPGARFGGNATVPPGGWNPPTASSSASHSIPREPARSRGFPREHTRTTASRRSSSLLVLFIRVTRVTCVTRGTDACETQTH